MHRFSVLPIALALSFALFAAESAQSATPPGAETAPTEAAKKGAEAATKRAASSLSVAKPREGSAETSPKIDSGGSKKSGTAKTGEPGSAKSDTKSAKLAAPKAAEGGAKLPPAWARKSADRGVVRLVRGAETLEIRVLDRQQHVLAATIPHFSRFLRSRGGAGHPIDLRLVGLLGKVSDHFGGRELTVVSGFRPYSPNQFARHSNHNEGRAIDFYVKGIANETVRDFCRTLAKVGVGYYPNSSFVHLDVRDTSAYWVDYASAGQAPRYRAPDVPDSDEDDDEPPGVATVDASSAPKPAPSSGSLRDLASGENATPGVRHESAGSRGVFVTH